MQRHLAVGFFLVLGVPSLIVFAVIYRRYLTIRFFHAFLLALAGTGAAVGALMATEGRILDTIVDGGSVLLPYSRRNDDGEVYAAVAWILMVMCGLGLLGKIYRAWIRDGATAEEREPNGKGIRAWLGVGNLVMGVFFVAAAYFARGWNPIGTVAMVVGLLLAYPVVNIVLKTGESPANTESEEVAEERRRVLAMVEAGKISGEDGAELIGALRQSHVMASPGGLNLSGNRRVTMLGAVLVVIGFCLPWFTAREMPQMAQIAAPVEIWQELFGGDIGYGLGWIILVMSAAVALLPLVWPSRRENLEQQRGATLVGILVGTVLVMYLVAKMHRFVDIGIVVVMAGYVVMWVGVVRENVRIGAGGRVVAG